MKKIIRIASVIALASASLLYVGCTKDFSADIAKTNQDVAALSQKVESLNSTVQTINGTVESLKTTKADLSKVEELDAAIKSALEKKIGELEASLNETAKTAAAAAADAAAAKTDAAAAQAAADAVAEDLKKANARLDTVIADVKNVADSLDIVAANVIALRADVDSLQNWQGKIDDAIETLTGKVEALAVRITSIVAVPSVDPEIQKFDIDTAGKETYIDTTIFKSSFAVAPKTAVEDLDAKNFKVHFKTGLSKDDVAPVDTAIDVKNIVKDVVNGIVTVFTPAPEPKSLTKGSGKTLYYSLSYTGKDDAGEYAEYSEFVKAHRGGEEDVITLQKSGKVVTVKDGVFAEIKDADKTLTDTIAFNAGDNTAFGKLLTTEKVTVAFNINDNLISAEKLGEIVGKPVTVKIDTAAEGFTKEPGFKVTGNGTFLYKATSDSVGNVQTISAGGFVVNGFNKDNISNLACELTEKHTIGAKTVEYTLPEVKEPWTYTSWDKVSRTVTITGCEDVHNVVPDTGIASVNKIFRIYKDPGTGVNIAVNGAARNKAAKDTVYNVAFKNTADISKEVEPDTVNFTINWQYTLEGRPADETIALADVDTLAKDYTKRLMLAIDSKIVDKTFAEFADAYDKAIDTTVVKNAIKAETSAIYTANVYFEGDTLDPWNVSNGKVEVPAHTKAGAYAVELEAKVFGITYTYTYTINIDWTAALKLHATPYVSAHEAIVDADTTAYPYTLQRMDIGKYLQVFNADTLAKGFEEYRVDVKIELEDSAKFANEFKDTTVGKFDYSETGIKVVDGVLDNNEYMEWNGYQGREVKVTAFLATGTDTVDTYTFTLKYNKPITSFAAGTQEVKRVAGQDAEAVLTKSFKATGLYHGDKDIIVDTTGAWIDGNNYYGCDIFFDFDNAVFKVDGTETTFTEYVDYSVAGVSAKDETTGLYRANPRYPEKAVITFYGENNNKPIEAIIPVVFRYKYDYNWNEAYKDNVVIKVVNE